MFGMLDYRAHKLYLLLFFIPNTLMWLLSIFGYPFVSYLIGFRAAESWGAESWGWKAMAATLIFLLAGFVWSAIVYVYGRLIYGLFTLFVDVVPADGRNEEQAKLVVYGGKAAADLIAFDLDPQKIDDQLIERIAKRGAFSILFADKVRQRCIILRNFLLTHPGKRLSEWQATQLLMQTGNERSLFETVLTNPTLRAYVLQTAFFVFLVLINPSGGQ
jgi:hypothetical protein